MQADGRLASRLSSIKLQDGVGLQFPGGLICLLRTPASEELALFVQFDLEHKVDWGQLKGWLSAEPHAAHVA